jgi:hypothetical protein
VSANCSTLWSGSRNAAAISDRSGNFCTAPNRSRGFTASIGGDGIWWLLDLFAARKILNAYSLPCLGATQIPIVALPVAARNQLLRKCFDRVSREATETPLGPFLNAKVYPPSTWADTDTFTTRYRSCTARFCSDGSSKASSTTET